MQGLSVNRPITSEPPKIGDCVKTAVTPQWLMQYVGQTPWIKTESLHFNRISIAPFRIHGGCGQRPICKSCVIVQILHAFDRNEGTCKEGDKHFYICALQKVPSNVPHAIESGIFGSCVSNLLWLSPETEKERDRERERERKLLKDARKLVTFEMLVTVE